MTESTDGKCESHANHTFNATSRLVFGQLDTIAYPGLNTKLTVYVPYATFWQLRDSVVAPYRRYDHLYSEQRFGVVGADQELERWGRDIPQWSYSPDPPPLPNRSWYKVEDIGKAQSQFQQRGWPEGVMGNGGWGMGDGE